MIVAAARRTSPGLIPYSAALARSTSTSICGTSTWSSTLLVDEPSIPASMRLDLVRLLAQDLEVGAEDADDDRLRSRR